MLPRHPPRNHKLFRQKNIPRVIFCIESMELLMPWDMHLSQTSEKGPHMDLTAFGPLGLGKGREWKERGTGWTFTFLLLSGSPQFHHPSPLLSYGSCIWRSSSPQFTGVSYHNFLMDGSTQGETDGRVERERQSREKLMHSRKKSIVSRRGGEAKRAAKAWIYVWPQTQSLK